MRVLLEVTADVRHIHAATVLCSIFDGFYKDTTDIHQDDLLSELVPALATLFVILDGAPEGYGHVASIEHWARETPDDTKRLIGLMRSLADRMEVA
jgi:hypothetical protein